MGCRGWPVGSWLLPVQESCEPAVDYSHGCGNRGYSLYPSKQKAVHTGPSVHCESQLIGASLILPHLGGRGPQTPLCTRTGPRSYRNGAHGPRSPHRAGPQHAGARHAPAVIQRPLSHDQADAEGHVVFRSPAEKSKGRCGRSAQLSTDERLDRRRGVPAQQWCRGPRLGECLPSGVSWER